MKRLSVQFRSVVAAAVLTAAPFAALAVSAQTANAEVGSNCPITFHWNGQGNVSNTLWVDNNPCSRPSRIKSWCNTWPGVNYSRLGNIVTLGASKATCDYTDNPVGVAFDYEVNGTWYEYNFNTTGSFTFYT
jgi:uncharacterized membrane protein